MRKYGIHWGRCVLGTNLFLATRLFWAGQVFQMPINISSVPPFGTILLWNILVFLGTRKMWKDKERALQAAEDSPLPQLPVSHQAPSTTPLPLLLRQVFDISWAIISVVTVAAHVISGTVGIVATITYTLLIPALLTAGFYIMGTSKVPEQQPEAAPIPSLQPVVPATQAMPPTRSIPEEIAPAATVQRG